jgi:antitoxin MazE
MEGQIGKWGNSLALRIPSSVAREASVSEGKPVEISVRKGSIVITPIDKAHRYSLDELVAGITEENRHEETATGPAVGNEFA